MDIKTILQDERKKKVLIIVSVALLAVAGLIFFLTRTGGAPQDDNSQLLSDIALLSPRDGTLDRNFQKATMIALSTDRPAITPGESATVSWTSSNATSCTDSSGNPLALKGDLTVSPTAPYTFDITCNGPEGAVMQSVEIMVTTAPYISLSASPSSVFSGKTSLISWRSINTDRCVDSTGKQLRLSGSFSISPKTPYTFNMSCTGPKGSTKGSITVTIATPPPPAVAQPGTPTTITPKPGTPTTITPKPGTPTTITPKPGTPTVSTPSVSKDGKSKLDASADKTTVKYGESATVTWETTNATNCKGSTTTGVKLISPIDIPEKNIVKGGTMLNLLPGYEVPLENNGYQEIRVLPGKDKANLIIRCESSDGSIIEKIITIKADTNDKDYCLGTSNPASKKFGKGSANLELDGDLAITGGTSRDVTYTAECAIDCSLTLTPWAESIIRYTEEEYASMEINQSNPDWSIKELKPYAGLVGSPATGGTVRVYPGRSAPAGTSGLIPAPTTIPTSGGGSGVGGSGVGFTPPTPQTVTVKLSCGSKYGAAGTKDTTAGRRTAESVTSIIPPASSGDCGDYVSCAIDTIVAVVVGGVCTLGTGGACIGAAVAGVAAVQ